MATMIERAYARANECLAAGGGFTFTIEVSTGATYTGIPPSTDAIEAPAGDFLELEIGDARRLISIPSIVSIMVNPV